MKNRIITLAACALAFAAAHAADVPQPKVYDIDVAVDEDARKLNIDIDLLIKDISLGADREIILTPVIINEQATDSLVLEPITVCGRNRWYWHLRQGLDVENGDARVFRAGKGGHARISESVPFQDWMGQCTVELRQDAAACCGTPELVPGTSTHSYTELAQIDTRRPPLIEQYVFAPPVEDAPVEKSLEGKAFVSFVVNRTELKPDYMVNRREIAKIINSIDYVRNDTDAVITGIHIKGFASPEGPYSNNVRLAKGRTQTLSNYVRDLYHFDDSIVTNSFNPEDWPGLRSYITDSLDFDIKHRNEILALIDSEIEPDTKDRLIKTEYPQDYKVILKEIYPWLRHSDYTVRYRIKVYTDIKELNRLYASDPSMLRPVDFYTIAAQYPEASPEYLDVMKTAVVVYPDNQMLNLNAANICLSDGELEKAQAHLAKAGASPQANFARGVLAARRANYDEALQWFSSAKEAGIDKADQYIQNINSIKDYHPVTITVETTRK